MTYVDTITTREDRAEAYAVMFGLAHQLTLKGKQDEFGVRVVGRTGVFHIELHSQEN